MMKSIASTSGATSELHLFDAPVGNDVLDREPSSERAIARTSKRLDKRPVQLAKAAEVSPPRVRAPYVTPRIVSSAFDAACLDPCSR